MTWKIVIVVIMGAALLLFTQDFPKRDQAMTYIGNCWGENNYDPEFHEVMGNKQCPICGRLFSEHSRDEFCNHLREIEARVRQQGGTIERHLEPILASDPSAKPKDE